jgi:enoyl-[acyl-carrier protein] reductase I
MGNNILKGKKGIVFGVINEHSLAWSIAKNAKEEGAEIILTNVRWAVRLGWIEKLAESIDAKVITADATKIEDLHILVEKAMDHFGGKYDFIVHSIGISYNVVGKIPYPKINYENFFKTIDCSALSLHKIISVSMQHDAINDWGAILSLTYLGSSRISSGYNEMAEAKSLLETISRNYGYYLAQEKKIRINTISQSITKTKASMGLAGDDHFEKAFNIADFLSPLGNAPADDCGKFCVMMLSDYAKMVTMQNIMHDGGFSSTMMTEKALQHFSL